MKEKLKKLIERRAAYLAEIEKPETDEKRFAELRTEIAKVDFSIEETKREIAEEEREEELRAARKPNATPETDAEKRGKEITIFNGANAADTAELAKPDALRYAKSAL